MTILAHVLLPDGSPGDAFMSFVTQQLHDKFGIQHANIQIETDPGAGCRLEPAYVY